MPRCPNGTRKNKKTGACIPYEKKVLKSKSNSKSKSKSKSKSLSFYSAKLKPKSISPKMHRKQILFSASSPISSVLIRKKMMEQIIKTNNDSNILGVNIQVKTITPTKMGNRYIYRGVLSYPQTEIRKSGYSAKGIDDGLLYNSHPSIGFTWKQL